MNPSAPEPPAVDPKAIFAIDRPHPRLLWQFMLLALLSGPALPFFAVYLYFRFHTLRYRFDEEGVSISYGILFRREAYLTYARIQDIHLKRNLIERWLGLGTVEVETAAGSGAGSESIVGLTEHEAVRDFLYQRMRGASTVRHAPAAPQAASVELLREIRDALRDVRAALKEPR